MIEEDRKTRERRERVEAQRDADAETREPVESYDTTARPGTLETGKPDRDQLAEGERMDLREKIARNYQPPGVGTDTGTTADFSSDDAMERARPSRTHAGRMDRSEFTGHRSQTQDRTGNTEVDTQGEQQTRRHVGLDTEPQRGGRSVPVESDTGRQQTRGEDIEQPRPDREHESREARERRGVED